MEHRTKSYLQLIKPGITLSNTLTAIAGFCLAVSFHAFSLLTFIGVIGGVGFVIASACVVNNIIDRDRDVQMKRTKKREIPSGRTALSVASIYAFVLGIIGFGLLYVWTNTLTLWLGIVAYVWYIGIYGIAKRTTPLSTIIGGVCGALPPVAGYTAVVGHLDGIAWTLFALMMIWQLPHFYAISIFRNQDYKNAKLPVWSVRYGSASTKAQIFFWIVIYTLITPLLTLLGATGVTFLVVMLAAGMYWIYIAAKNYKKLDDMKWSRKVFGVSLLVLLIQCGAIAVGPLLP